MDARSFTLVQRLLQALSTWLKPELLPPAPPLFFLLMLCAAAGATTNASARELDSIGLRPEFSLHSNASALQEPRAAPSSQDVAAADPALKLEPAVEEPGAVIVWKRGWFSPPSLRIEPLAGPISGVPKAAIVAAQIVLMLVLFLIIVYTVRHFFFTLNRLFGEQRHPYLDIDTAQWPSVTVLIPAHNEEAVIGNSMRALLDVDYPSERLTIMPVNDRSTDGTRAVIDELANANPQLIDAYHRDGGTPGKAAALKDATGRVLSDIIIVFDADYLPGRGLLKQLVAPFFDPQTGSVMGRVVPINTGRNLLTRLLDMERAGGYQVDQQARMNLNLVPQYGGTVGGVRRAALEDVGGWDDSVLAEDTDLTYRLLLRGWKTVYQNRSECYEEVPETWPVRVRQIMRWAKGHNQVACRYVGSLLSSPSVSWIERLDGFLLLGVYMMAPALLLGWLMTVFLFYFSSAQWLAGSLALIALMSYAAIGNFAAFFEISAAAYLDGSDRRLRLLPLNFFGFLVSLLSVTRSTLNQIIFDGVCKRSLVWDKTLRYGTPAIAEVPKQPFVQEQGRP